MGKGKMTCGTAEVLRPSWGEWTPRRGRTLGRLGEVGRPVGGERFLAWSGRRFVVTKYRRAKRAR